MHSANQKPRPHRCAIYTRRSVEQLDQQQFSSAQAQRAIMLLLHRESAAEWFEVAKNYDDEGWSGVKSILQLHRFEPIEKC